MDRIETMMKEFTEAAGVSGSEGDVSALLARHLSPIARIEKDRLGSCIARLKGSADRPRVMLAAHMDEVGFMVSHFSGSFVRFNPLGGWWYPRMIGLSVVISTSKGDVPGVIATKNPYEMEDEERKGPFKAKDLYIDVGLAGKKSPESLGIRPGDPVVPCLSFTALDGGRTLMAKAWDDRAGCVMLVEVLAALAKAKRLPNAVFGVGTVQEEVGIRGAVTSGFQTNPDVCIILEVDIAQDTPGSSEGSPGRLGAGVSICVYDATLIPNTKLRDHVVAIARRRKIPYQFSAVPFGGTDGGRIHLNAGGVPTIVVAVPARHIHSAAGIICRKDLDNAVKLVTEVVKTLDAKTVAALA
jgi:putative aminopeptidase FrvX